MGLGGGGCLVGCPLIVELFELIAYLTGLNSNPSGFSDLWVAARPSGSLEGGSGRLGRYSGIKAQGSKEICNGLITMAVPKKASSGDLQQLEASLDIGGGFPDHGLEATTPQNPEESSFGGFLGLPKESFNDTFDPFGDLLRGKKSPLCTQKSDPLKLDPAIFHDKKLAGVKEKTSPAVPWSHLHPRARRKEILEDILHFLGQPKESFSEHLDPLEQFLKGK
ncbi:hypothetical protein Taro_040601 [Colocasia esculenta]|uniref:Uncharacterized protein n=1 Tax=Colocasia esculenta TaxID=4460 RepID=A0A843WMD4_COLES|nr:hypothetical protein [Colocasia esculenta]